MLKLNSSASYAELADEFWLLYNSGISDISEALDKVIRKKGWEDLFFVAEDAEPPASVWQYRSVLQEVRDDILTIITGVVASSIDNASVVQLKSDSVTIELDDIPDFEVELNIKPKFCE